MNTMKWLLRREFWEHKGGFVWAPLIAAIIMVVLVGGVLGYGVASGKMAADNVSIRVDGEEVHHTSIANVMTSEKRAEVASMAANNYIAVGAPIFVVLPVVAFFYCLAALYDDRRDRSILFWKSLPISDADTVLSKLVTVLVVAPMITIGVATAAALAIWFLGALAASHLGISLFGPVLTNVNFYLAPLYLVGMVPVYILWALPTAGWLLLVSSWAKSKVFLWAVGVPLITAVLLKWLEYLIAMTYQGPALNIGHAVQKVLEAILLGLIPGTWFMNAGGDLPMPTHQGVDMMTMLAYSWSTLSKPELWAGVLAGVAMIFAAIRLRRWRDEG
ncbi:ABC transporter permease subunit [Massilia litorea]|uniref:ABC transporter permease subunit n=1 Tax=Massilia litorea TaxID=2769491 RepID=A0A7L9U2T0_9BURK|nr:ABC transporter permease subunit [Massilia litorea]QOL49237.1 ABC transporter permease subunit [Massilia litorea]